MVHLLSCTPHSCRLGCICKWPWCEFPRCSAASPPSAWRCVAGNRSRCFWMAAWAPSWRRWGGQSGSCGCSGPRSAPATPSGTQHADMALLDNSQGLRDPRAPTMVWKMGCVGVIRLCFSLNTDICVRSQSLPALALHLQTEIDQPPTPPPAAAQTSGSHTAARTGFTPCRDRVICVCGELSCWGNVSQVS